jgi:SAM-dependent methyltransferase
MALSAGWIHELIELKRTGALDGARRVVDIGAHQLHNSFLQAKNDLDELYALYGVPQPFLGNPKWAGALNGFELLHDEAPPSEPFWTSLGFSYAAIEYGGHRGAISLDLNRDAVPFRMRRRFDLVVNAGTTEHVANQENAFRVIHDLAAPGALMIHSVPGGGEMTHGLFCYTLKFFWRLCRENEYEIVKLRMAPFAAGPAHPDVVQSNARWGGANDYPALPAEISDLGILAILRKPANRRFVTPLDLPG